jgi:hypothetical protein
LLVLSTNRLRYGQAEMPRLYAVRRWYRSEKPPTRASQRGQRGLSLERGGSQGNLIDSLDSVMRRDGSGKHKAQANCIHLR